ncbi:MAG: sodium-dependent transporter [Methanobrevibacter sp.]|jgi:NSS family neurotransmitter:Na+ symporter|nr:sodium-dependent transporter [Candidatus Methanovirga australis]
MDKINDNKVQWNSYFSFLFSMIGAAIGLGNIWRYPYVLYSNGRGTFLIVYLISILVVGIPFLLLEYSVGFKFNTSIPKIFKTINSKLEVIGWFIVVLPFLILTYYVCVIGWDGIYFILSFFKGWGTNTDYFFSQTLLQSTNSTTGLTNLVLPCLASVLIVWFIIWFISHRDLNDGIGKVNKIMIPAIFLIMGVIVFFSLTLKGASFGLTTLFNPDWNEIYNPHIWIAAISQIIFSLAIGEGIILTYSSYLPKNSKLTDNAITIISINCGFELFAAIGVFSILGFMATTTGIDITQIISEGTGLAFVVFPEILNIMGSTAYIIGPLFFLCIFLAGLTSAIAYLESVIYAVEEKFNFPRKKATTYLCLIGATMTIIFTTGMGIHILEVADKFLNYIGGIFSIILELIIFSWLFRSDELLNTLNNNSTVKIGEWWVILIKYVLPTILFCLWINELINMFNTSNFKLITNIFLSLILISIPLILKIKS